MLNKGTGAGGSTAGPERAPGVTAELLNVQQLAELLQLSHRTIYRLADCGAMPYGLRLGGSRRWRRGEIQRWLDAGCPRVDGKGGRGNV